jgi:hypothetical protein
MRTVRSMIGLGLLLAFCQTTYSQEGISSDMESRLEAVSDYLSIAATEKVFLHLDKDDYHAGDNIWFKAYVVDGKTQTPIQGKINLYVELVNPGGNITDFILLNLERGTANGQINLPDSMPEGNYRLSAYTSRIMNQDKQMAFTRELYIRNVGYENLIPQSAIRSNKRINRTVEKELGNLSIYFFPEGGNLIAGTENTVAFRAVDGTGRSLTVQGELLDNQGSVLTTIAHEIPGYGLFRFTPEEGVNYQVSASLDGQSKKAFSLPSVRGTGMHLRMIPGEKEISVQIRDKQISGTAASQVHLVFHSHAAINLQKRADLRNGEFVASYNFEDFPAGVNRLTLLDLNMNPLAERLFYVPPSNIVSFGSKLFVQEVDQKKYFQLAIRGVDGNEQPVKGDFSLSVQSGAVRPLFSSENILYHLSLASELRGLGGEVFGEVANSENMYQVVDLLMMTHGWKRHSLKDLLQDAPAVVDSPIPSAGITVTGRLFDPVTRYYMSNFPIQMKIPGEQGGTFTTSTDQDGYFVFSDLYFEGPVKVEFSYRPGPTGIYPEFQLITKEPESAFGPAGLKKQRITEKGPQWKRIRTTERVIAASQDPSQESRPMYGGSADQTIIIDNKLVNYRTLLNVLSEKAVGFTVQGGQIVFRGTSSFALSNEPIFVLDGSMIDKNTFLNVSPAEIQRIEIYKGANAAIFGVRGTNGAIVGYSRRYSVPNTGSPEFVIRGYQMPAEFYQDHVKARQISAKYPQYVSTIHWDGSIFTNEDGESVSIFPFTEGLGKLKVIIQGFGENGEIGFGEFIYDFGK